MRRRPSCLVPSAVAAICCLITASGCSGSSSGPSPSATPTTTVTASSEAGSSPAGSPAVSSPAGSPAGSPAVTSAEAAASPTAAAAGRLVLEPDGLGVVTGASVRHVPFGTDLATVSRLLTNTLGPVTRTPMPECGQGPRVQLGSSGVNALFDGTRFVGWTDTGRVRPRLTTVAGVGVGSTLASVRDVLAHVTVVEGTLGPEFTVGDQNLGGILDGTAPTSRITLIYAGETCFFR